MVRAVFSSQGGLSTPQENALAGLTDLQIAIEGDTAALFAVTRSDGWLTSFDVGAAPGQTRVEGQWAINLDLVRLEKTDLVLHETGGQIALYMAGLNASDLTGVRIDLVGSGSPFLGTTSVSASGFDTAQFTNMALFAGSDQGIAALRDGGLVNVSFGANNQLSISDLDQSTATRDAHAKDITTTTHNGQTFAFVSYEHADTISMFRQENGTLRHMADVNPDTGMWADKPSALAVTQDAGGTLYVVAAASGSGSLSILEVSPDGRGITPVDHLLDSLDTRFANASHVTSLTVGGQNFVLAAGNDQGISLLTVLPGGRLQHLDAMAGTAETPLRGITAIEAMATPDGIRVWASTEAAPYLSEFIISLPNIGETQFNNPNGGALNGAGRDDILVGGDGADVLSGNDGDDILMDGGGIDQLTGGSGADTFIFFKDDARDTVTDFDPLLDHIDLSDFTQLDAVGTLSIVSRSWGAEISIGKDVLEVRSADGARLSNSDFTPQNLITGNRIETDTALYLPSGTTKDPDPVPDPEPDPDMGPDPLPDTGPPTSASPAGAAPVTPFFEPEPTVTVTWRAGDTRGGDSGDTFTGFGQADRIFGGGGNDTMNAGVGADTLSGDAGDDLAAGADGDDLIAGGEGNDTLMGGNGADTLSGGAGADSLDGGNDADMLIGGAGVDRLEGRAGNDQIWGGDGADRIFGGIGDDWISAGANAGFSVDGVWGEGGNDTIFGNEGTDLLNGGTGNDVLDGGEGEDKLFGEDGNDILTGGSGFDRLFGGDGDDKLSGGGDGDGLFGQNGNDTLWGDAGDDRFFGGDGDDVLDGGADHDTLSGEAGRDTLYGSTGDDQLQGGADADEFVFADRHGNDVVTDFDPDDPNEVLNLTQIMDIEDFEDVIASSTQSGTGVLIRTGEDSSILLENVNRVDLDKDDFAF